MARKISLTLGALALLAGAHVLTSRDTAQQEAVVPATTTSATQPTPAAVADITPTTTQNPTTTGPAVMAAPPASPAESATPTTDGSIAQTTAPTTTPVVNPPTAANQVLAAVYNVNINQTIAEGTVRRHITAFTGIPAGTTIPTGGNCSAGSQLFCLHRAFDFVLVAAQNRVVLRCDAASTNTVTIPITLPSGATDTLNITVTCT